MSVPYAVSTHVKTELTLDDGKTQEPFDFDRVFKIFASQGFRGYMGLEDQATGDPAGVVPGIFAGSRNTRSRCPLRSLLHLRSDLLTMPGQAS